MGSLKVGPEIFAVDFARWTVTIWRVAFACGAIRLPSGTQCTTGLISPVETGACIATAEGVVVYSGRKGRYGRMAEVDHGNGLRTRYAHLFRSTVKKGQKNRASALRSAFLAVRGEAPGRTCTTKFVQRKTNRPIQIHQGRQVCFQRAESRRQTQGKAREKHRLSAVFLSIISADLHIFGNFEDRRRYSN